jgi:hypothetical protein
LTKRAAQEIAVEAGADEMLTVIVSRLGHKGKEVRKELGLLDKNMSGDAIHVLFDQRKKCGAGDSRVRIAIMGDDFPLLAIAVIDRMGDTENDSLGILLQLPDAPQEPLCLA